MPPLELDRVGTVFSCLGCGERHYGFAALDVEFPVKSYSETVPDFPISCISCSGKREKKSECFFNSSLNVIVPLLFPRSRVDSLLFLSPDAFPFDRQRRKRGGKFASCEAAEELVAAADLHG